MQIRCLLALSLIVVSSLTTVGEDVGFPPWPECYENSTPESIAFKRDAFRDPAKLKAELLRFLPINGRFDFKEFPWFKKTFEVQDEVLRPVLLEIYKESRKKDLSDPNNHLDWLRTMRSLTGLGICADNNTKQLLLSLATEVSDVRDMRMRSLAAYLQTADPEEAKNALIRFLVEGERMDSQTRSSICRYALAAFKDASPEKKAAILESLYAALSREDNKWLFRVYDDILCKISKEYANSHQRLAILKRLINAPSLCKVDDYAMPELQEKLKVLQKMRLYTNINTNLTTLNGRDFNLPLPVSATNEVAETTSESTDTKVGVENKQAKKRYSIDVLSLIGGAAVLILGLGLWHLSRKR